MARSIKAEIGSKKEIKIEFSGFPGDSCFDEAKRLKEVLEEFGLWAIPVTVSPKTSSEIARELGESIGREKKVPH